jgi:hypothetical protein
MTMDDFAVTAGTTLASDQSMTDPVPGLAPELPLSAAQLGIWYAIKAGTSASAFSIAEYTRIFGSVDKALFETALRQLISEVEVLRLRFFESDGAVRQRVAEPDEWRLSYFDVTQEADPLRSAETWMQADAAQPVSVEQWPLFGFALFKLRTNEFLWFFRSHHLTMDGYSGQVVTRRLAEIYSANLKVAQEIGGWSCAERDRPSCCRGSSRHDASRARATLRRSPTRVKRRAGRRCASLGRLDQTADEVFDVGLAVVPPAANDDDGRGEADFGLTRQQRAPMQPSTPISGSGHIALAPA